MRPNKADLTSLGVASLAVHGGNVIDATTGAVRTPLVMANSYHLPENPEDMDWSSPDGLVYTRNAGHNQVCLEKKLAAMEGGEAAAAFATGVAALHSVFFTFLKSGDHVVVGDVTYEAVWRLFAELLPERYGIEATFVNMGDLDAVRKAIKPNTKLIHTESIGNPTTKVADIERLAEIVNAHGALLSVDATFTPPPFFQAIRKGAHLVVHSLTKYINGHGDAMGGIVIGSRELIGKIKHDALVDLGAVISPFNAWMIMRGSVTLPLRIRQHLCSAEKIAAYLDSEDRIAYVCYPGLPSHPQHELAVRQFEGKGFGAVMAFAVHGDSSAQNRFVANLKVITSAVSLGHDESLIVHVGPDARGGSEHYPPEFLKYGHLRLSVGLEDAEDLINDITAALDETFRK
jgi:cystathionine beta-lyase/cystathionine gamma-synthase